MILIGGISMKNFLYICFVMIFILCNIQFAGAQIIQIITLDQAMDQAIKNNLGLRATQAKLGVSEAQILTANTRLNPALVTDNGVAEKSYRLGIAQTIELGGKRQKRTALAEAQRDVVIT